MTTETRYPCPVCLGVKMEKLVITPRAVKGVRSLPTRPPARPSPRSVAGRAVPTGELVLDHCARCGGVWFEAGEVQRLRSCEAELLWREVVRREEPHAMLCHSCRSPMSRDAVKCAVCSWTVELDCPTCARPLELSREADMSLDYCRHCKGVWFDHTELAGIWKLEMNAAVRRRRGTAAAAGGDVLFDALYFDPFLMYYGVHAVGAAAQGLGHAAAGSAGALGEVAGAAGEAAAGVFETIVEIIAGIFG